MSTQNILNAKTIRYIEPSQRAGMRFMQRGIESSIIGLQQSKIHAFCLWQNFRYRFNWRRT